MAESTKPKDPALLKVLERSLVNPEDRVYVLDHEGAFQYQRNDLGHLHRTPIGRPCAGRR